MCEFTSSPSFMKTKGELDPSETTAARTITLADFVRCKSVRIPSGKFPTSRAYSLSSCVFVTASIVKMLLLLSCHLCLEAVEFNYLDCFLYALSLKSFLFILYINYLKIPSSLAVFLMILLAQLVWYESNAFDQEYVAGCLLHRVWRQQFDHVLLWTPYCLKYKRTKQ